MKITFIHHSSFMVESSNATYLFDYFPKEKIESISFQGVLPPIDKNKPLYVFASHGHHDHFDLSVLDLTNRTIRTTFILSKEIRLGKKYLESHGYQESIKEQIHFVVWGKQYKVNELLIQTIKSTDAGVAFVVQAPEVTIYHGGDLNLWKWEGAGDLINGRETSAFKSAIKGIGNIPIDLAFVPLDPRLGAHASEGMDYFLKEVNAKHVFPMHMWRDYKKIKEYKSQISNGMFSERIIEISGENQVFLL